LYNAGFKKVSIKKFGFFPPMISNTTFGYKAEKIFERIKIFYPILPFQIISAKKMK